MTAVVFDAYGTLFDLNNLAVLATEAIGDHALAQSVCRTWRTKQLDYAWTSVLMNRYQDFDKLTELALTFALQDASIEDLSVKTQLLSAYDTLPLFDDVTSTLDVLAESHKLAILSNATFRSLQKMTDAQGILFSFDYLLSVEPIRLYKPSRAAYQLAVDALHCEKSEIMFVSSNYWDVVGAKSFGFETVWCNRDGRIPDPIAPAPDKVVTSLHALQQLV